MIVLDTHAWVWWNASPGKLSATARQTIEEAAEIGVSAISCWEVAMLVSKKRLQLDRNVLLWIEEALAIPGTALLPISPRIAVLAGSLDKEVHGDPADRLIIATAMETGSLLVTRDHPIRSLPGVKTVW